MKKKTVRVNVVQDKEHIVEQNVLATAIVEISKAVKRLERSGLTFNAVVILTQHNCKSLTKYGNDRPGMSAVREVLRSIGELTERFVKP